MPTGQRTHAVESALATEPAGQASHESNVADDTEPGAQAWHEAEPVDAVYRPFWQFVHDVGPYVSVTRRVEYLPTGQSVHVFLGVTASVYLPSLHSEHATWPCV